MKAPEKFLRIPIRFVEDVWECEYGGHVPALPNARAEIVINTKSISDKKYVQRMLTKSSIKVLDEGTTLLVYLATKDMKGLSEPQRSVLRSWDSMRAKIATEHLESWSSGPLSLVEVHINDPTKQQARKFDTNRGGLWLLTEGPKTVGLQSTQIRLPEIAAKAPVYSLNHAFTKLSETFEPWRISHTGNVYQRFLYQESDGKWYPLEFLRSAALAQKEQEIAYQLWQDFLEKMSTETRSDRKA